MESQHPSSTVICSSMQTVLDLYNSEFLKDIAIHCVFDAKDEDRSFIEMLASQSGCKKVTFTTIFNSKS